jgi:hypothetical protein
VKRILLVVATLLMFVNTLVIPNAAHADGQATVPNCPPNQMCKP